MEIDKRLATPIPFVFWFRLQNMRRHMCNNYRGRCGCLSVSKMNTELTVYNDWFTCHVVRAIHQFVYSFLQWQIGIKLQLDHFMPFLHLFRETHQLTHVRFELGCKLWNNVLEIDGSLQSSKEVYGMKTSLYICDISYLVHWITGLPDDFPIQQKVMFFEKWPSFCWKGKLSDRPVTPFTNELQA